MCRFFEEKKAPNFGSKGQNFSAISPTDCTLQPILAPRFIYSSFGSHDETLADMFKLQRHRILHVGSQKDRWVGTFLCFWLPGWHVSLHFSKKAFYCTLFLPWGQISVFCRPVWHFNTCFRSQEWTWALINLPWVHLSHIQVPMKVLQHVLAPERTL